MSSTTSNTVQISNIADQTSEEDIRNFFGFCGKINHLAVDADASNKSATIAFDSDAAAQTALSLENTELGGNSIHVKHVTNPTAITSVDSTAEPAAAAAAAAASPPSQAAVNENTFANRSYTGNTALGETANVHSISQSEKPRTRILAEYLAYGYHISDQIIEQGIQFDRTNGISEGFQRAIKHFDVDFAAWDSKHHVSERAKQADDKHHFLNHARHAWNSIESYFEKALDTPRGLKLRQFYQEGNKTVRDVHGEARHLADLMDVKRRGGHDGQSHSNKEGEDCTCGSVAAYCPCPTGSCHCTNCAKNSGAAGVFVPQNVDGVNPSLSEGSKLTSQ